MKRAMLATLVAILATLPLGAAAQARFPAKPVTIVVPYPPGGSNDVFARAIGKKLSDAWGQPVIIENKPGAGGNIGAAQVSKSTAPDGYTLLVMSSSFTTGAAINPSMPFDPVKGLTPITMVARGPMILAVSNPLPVKDVGELIALAKKQPGKLNYASSGAGSTNQFATELWKAAAGVEMTHVPYKGMSPATTDLIGGHVDVLFASGPSILQHTKSGKARALGVTSLQPSPIAPELPALAQHGAPGFQFDLWWGFWGPPGMAPDLVSRIGSDISAAVASADMKEMFLREGADSVQMSPADFAKTVASEIEQWRKVAAKAGIKAE